MSETQERSKPAQAAQRVLQLMPERLEFLADILLGRHTREQFISNCGEQRIGLNSCYLDGKAGAFFDYVTSLLQDSRATRVHLVAFNTDCSCVDIDCLRRSSCDGKVNRLDYRLGEKGSATQTLGKYDLSIGEELTVAELIEKLRTPRITKEE